MGDKIAALKLAGTMLIFVITLLAIENSSRKGRHHGTGRTSSGTLRIQFHGISSILVSIFCAVPVLLGFLIPISVLAWLAIVEGDQLWGRSFASYASNSIGVAALAALIATALALCLAYVSRLHPKASVSCLDTLCDFGLRLARNVTCGGTARPYGLARPKADALVRGQPGLDWWAHFVRHPIRTYLCLRRTFPDRLHTTL